MKTLKRPSLSGYLETSWTVTASSEHLWRSEDQLVTPNLFGMNIVFNFFSLSGLLPTALYLRGTGGTDSLSVLCVMNWDWQRQRGLSCAWFVLSCSEFVPSAYHEMKRLLLAPLSPRIAIKMNLQCQRREWMPAIAFVPVTLELGNAITFGHALPT